MAWRRSSDAEIGVGVDAARTGPGIVVAMIARAGRREAA